MSMIRRFCSATKRTAKKVSNKAEKLTDTAVLKLKIKNLEMKVEEKYEELGRLVYLNLHTDDDYEDTKLRIVAEIDALFDRITELKQPPEQEVADDVAEEAPADAE